MSDGESEWEIHTYNHCTVVAPDDRGAIVERIGNEFSELWGSGLTIRCYRHFAAQVVSRIRQNHGNGLINDAKYCSVRCIGVHDTVNVTTTSQYEGMHSSLNSRPSCTLDNAAILIYHHNLLGCKQ